MLQRPVRLPDGRTAIWDLIDVPPTVTVLALTPDGDVVTVLQFRPGPDRVMRSLPGGLVDPGEDPLAAAARELLEETGFAATDLSLVAASHANGFTHTRHVAVATNCRRVGEPSLDPLEDIVVEVVSLAALRAGLQSGGVGALAETYLALDHAGLL